MKGSVVRKCVLSYVYVGDAFLDKINDSNIRVYGGKMETDRENVIVIHT